MPHTLTPDPCNLYPPMERHYNSDLSIWLSVDPMADYYPDYSPYVFCGNNPIKFMDEIGADFIDFNDFFNIDHPRKKDPNKPNSKENPYVLDEVIVTPQQNHQSRAEKRANTISIPFSFIFPYIGEKIATAIAATSVLPVLFSGLSILMQGDTRPQQSVQQSKETTQQIDKIAKEKGMTPVKGKFSHGQKFYKKGNKYYSRDVDKHNGGEWKVFEMKNGKLQRIGTADKDLIIFKK